MEAAIGQWRCLRILASSLVWAACSSAVAAGEERLSLRIDPRILLAQAIEDGVPGAPLPVPAIAGMPSRTEVEFGGSHESLTNGLPDWSSVYLEAAHTFKERHTLYGGLRETRRFGLDDTEAYGGLYYPLAKTLTGVLEGSASPTYNVLAKYSFGLQLLKSLPASWGIAGGIRHSEYSLAAADVASLTLERYWSNFRGAYTLYSGRPEGSSSAAAHRFQLVYYYGDRDWAGISYTTGREVEYVGPPRGTITSEVRDWTLSGRHWFAPRWAISYDLLTHEQGDLYRRRGGRVGIRHIF